MMFGPEELCRRPDVPLEVVPLRRPCSRGSAARVLFGRARGVVSVGGGGQWEVTVRLRVTARQSVSSEWWD